MQARLWHSLVIVHLITVIRVLFLLFHATCQVLIVRTHGGVDLLFLFILVKLKNFSEVFESDFIALSFVGDFQEDGLFVSLDVAQLELFENVAESVHAQLTSTFDVQQLERLLNWIKLLNHCAGEELVKFLSIHLLLAIEEEVDIRLLNFVLGARGLALDREGRQVLSQIALVDLFSLALRNPVHKVSDLRQAYFFISSHHWAAIGSLSSKNFSLLSDLLERLNARHFEEIVNLLFGDFVAVDSQWEISSKEASVSVWAIILSSLPGALASSLHFLMSVFLFFKILLQLNTSII